MTTTTTEKEIRAAKCGIVTIIAAALVVVAVVAGVVWAVVEIIS